MVGNLKALAALALLGGLLLGLGRMLMLSAENERLSARVADMERANQAMAYEIAANEAALARREDERRRLADESNQLKFKLGEVYEKDTLAADWADTACPDDVLECLRR